MARPTRLSLDNGQQAWDAVVNDDFIILLDNPIPIPQPAGLTESNLQSTYAAASYDRCLVWVNHSVRGYILYRSDGTNWKIVRGATEAWVRDTGGSGGAVNDYDDVLLCSGTGNYTMDLPAASGQAGRLLRFKKTAASGTVTIDANGSQTIDGALTLDLATQYLSYSLVCDGSNWSIV